MARPKRILTSSDTKAMQSTAKEWKKFREDNKLSQKFLAEVVGISRRTIQSVEAGLILPQKRTMDAFLALQAKYEAEGKPTGRRKKKLIVQAA